MATERRNEERRRHSDRRRDRPGASMDVTRLEHENLCNQVAENVRTLRRIEHEIRVIRKLLERPSRLQDAS